MDSKWKGKAYDLLSLVLQSDLWFVSPDSGVGAGIDSYYEYLLKAYILLGDDLFLQRFNIVRMHTHSYVYLPRVT